MKKLFLILMTIATFAVGADVKPFVFDNIAQDSAIQQDQYDYMLKYKLYGRDYFKMGGNNDIPDSSGWSGTANNFTTTDQVEIGGPILAGGSISVGNGNKLTTGPIRGTSFTMNNDNSSIFAGTMCLENTNVEDKVKTVVVRSGGEITSVCPDVPEAPVTLSMPFVKWPDTITQSINVGARAVKVIDIPEVETYDLYINSITTGSSGEIYFRMRDGGTLTRVFVNGSINLSDHTKIKVIYKTDSTDYVVPQNKFRGNLLFYTNEDFKIENTDYTELQGTFITTKKATLVSNIEFAGQILANELDIGYNFSGKNFRFVKFDPDTIDVKLDKYGGLRENDSTVTIPVELSDTTDINVYFTYCITLKDGVTVDDFNIPPEFPICGQDSKRVVIPIGSKVPNIPIQVNVKIDTIVEPDDYLALQISDITGAILPNGKTDGELKIKIIDAPTQHVGFDTTAIYKFNENDTGFVSYIKVVNETQFTRFYLDSSCTDRYTLDSITGELNLVKYPLDYEATTVDMIKVTLKDTGDVTVSRLIPIGVIDVNEAPVINDTTFKLEENKPVPSIVGVVKVNDQDKKNDFRQNLFKIVEGDSCFAIDNNGRITSNKIFNYEKDKTEFTLKVMVYDKNYPTVLFDTATVVINIVNENDPPELQPNDSLIVPENCKSCVVGIITAIDPDNDPIKYTVKEPGFKIDTNGVLKLTDPLDYEKTPVVKVTITATDPSGYSDTATYTIKVSDINEPVHTKDTTCSVKENYTGNVCKIPGTDEDGKKPIWIVTDTVNYSIDTTGQLVIKTSIDYEKKTKDTVKVIVTDGEFSDTATVIINVIDEDEKPEITKIDDKPPVDTLKTNEPDHKIDYQICEGDSCEKGKIDVPVKRDTTVKICNSKKTVCDSVVILYNDAPPVVILTNAKSTETYIDYITIEEQKDDKIYVNKKDNQIMVTVKDTVHKTEKHFDIEVTLDTIPSKDIKLKEYNYLIDETNAKVNHIDGNKAELVETFKDNGTEITLTKIVNAKTGDPVDTVQTISYKKKVNGKDIVITYKVDNLTGTRISDYEVSYMIDSCTKVTYTINDKNKIVKNKEGNIGYKITYDYVDDFGNKASASVEVVYDDIPPKVEILEPLGHETFKTNAIPVKWTVNGEVQDTLTLQRLEKGVNYVIRRYVDKAGNASADTVWVMMKEAKAIDINLIHPVNEIDQDKVDEFYSNGEKYDPKKPYKVTMVNPKDDSLPETIGVGFKIDIALPSVSATGGLATLDDIVKDGQIPVDDKGNIVGASNLSIPVEEYINENCTDDFRQDYHKNGTNIPLYNVKYNLHLWIYTSNANYVNDFEINYDIDSKTEANSASIANFVIDWVPEKDGNVKAKNHHSLGTGAYLVKLYSKSTAIYRCGFKNQKAGDKITKKEYNLKSFGYKRPNK